MIYVSQESAEVLESELAIHSISALKERSIKVINSTECQPKSAFNKNS